MDEAGPALQWTCVHLCQWPLISTRPAAVDTLSHRALVNDQSPSPCSSHTSTHTQVVFLSSGYLGVSKFYIYVLFPIYNGYLRTYWNDSNYFCSASVLPQYSNLLHPIILIKLIPIKRKIRSAVSWGQDVFSDLNIWIHHVSPTLPCPPFLSSFLPPSQCWASTSSSRSYPSLSLFLCKSQQWNMEPNANQAPVYGRPFFTCSISLLLSGGVQKD